MLIGIIIFATDKGPEVAAGVRLYDTYDLHAGFALVIVAAILAIAGGVLMFLAPSDE